MLCRYKLYFVSRVQYYFKVMAQTIKVQICVDISRRYQTDIHLTYNNLKNKINLYSVLLVRVLNSRLPPGHSNPLQADKPVCKGNGRQSFQTTTKASGPLLPSVSLAEIRAVVQSNYLQAPSLSPVCP